MSSNKQNYNQSNNHSQSSSDQSSQSNNGNNTCQASDYSITKQYGEMKGILKIDIVMFKKISFYELRLN